MSEIICPKCGGDIRSKSRFCGKCGYEIEPALQDGPADGKIPATDTAGFSAKIVLSKGIKMYMRNFPLMILYGVLGTLLANIAQVVKTEKIVNTLAQMLIQIAGLVVSYVAMIGFLKKTRSLYYESDEKSEEQIPEVSFFRVIAAVSIYISVVFIGGVLLIVPGIIAAVIFLFAIPAAVMEDDYTSPFKYSKALVKGDFWKVFIIFLATVGLMYGLPFLVGIIYGLLDITGSAAYTSGIILNIFTWPFMFATITIGYLEMKRLKDEKIDRTNMASIGEGMGCLIALVLNVVVLAGFISLFNYLKYLRG